MREDEKRLREKKAADAKRQAVLSRVSQALANHKKAHDQFLAELAPMLAEIGDDLKASELAILVSVQSYRLDDAS